MKRNWDVSLAADIRRSSVPPLTLIDVSRFGPWIRCDSGLLRFQKHL